MPDLSSLGEKTLSLLEDLFCVLHARCADRLGVTTPEPKALYRRKDVAELLSVSVWTVDKLRRDGKLNPVMVGQQARYTLAEVNRLVDQIKRGEI